MIIKLTGRRPVEIDENEWPIEAEARDSGYDGQFDFQSNRKWQARLVVRKHADGRRLVYGRGWFSSAYPREKNREESPGYLLGAGIDIAMAVKHVAEALCDLWHDVPNLAQRLFEQLPPEKL